MSFSLRFGSEAFDGGRSQGRERSAGDHGNRQLTADRSGQRLSRRLRGVGARDEAGLTCGPVRCRDRPGQGLDGRRWGGRSQPESRGGREKDVRRR